MAFEDFEEKYEEQYHTYPVHSNEVTHEGAFKRFMPMPMPKEVFDYALLGLPKYFPLTNEPITVDGPVSVEDHLVSAVTEIEMKLGCNLSPVTHFHSEDYIDGMFSANYMGMKLRRWPATKIVDMVMKYPHTNTTEYYQKYTIPPGWIYLRTNKLNVIAAVGSVAVDINSPSTTSAGGIFSYITGFARGAYQPGSIEIKYTAGFEHDKLPGNVADLIKTWAAHRYLADIGPTLFPNSSVNVSIDGVSQGVSYNVQQAIEAKIQRLAEKKDELAKAFKKQFASTINMSFIGA